MMKRMRPTFFKSVFSVPVLLLLGVTWAMIPVLMAGCSPKVITQVVKSYPSVSRDSVLVAEQEEDVPEGAKTVGYLSVTDRGSTTNCNYAQVLTAAVTESAKNGGNVLRIDEHLRPDDWSPCHRIDATMLHLDSLPANFRRHPELEALYSERRKSQHPSMITKLNVGKGFVMSKIYVNSNECLSGRGGFEVEGSIEGYNSRGIGWGLNAFYNNVSLDSYGSMAVFYIGPLCSIGARVGQHWRMGLQAGIGLIGLIDHTKNPYYSRSHQSANDIQAGVGFQFSTNFEYMFNGKFGLGFDMNSTVGHMVKPSYFKLADNEFYGIGHLALLLGVRYYY